MHANDRKVTQFTALGHGLFHTYELSIPLFIGAWMDQFGLSALVVGAVVGAGYGLIGLGAPVSGVLADYFGSRQLILASIFGMGAGFALTSFSWGSVSLGLAILFWGAAASIYHPAGLSLISRVATERGTVFAYHGVGGNLGTALGPLSTAVLLSVTSWRVAASVLALPALVALAAGIRIEFDAYEGNDETLDSFRTGLGQTVADSRGLFSLGFVIAFVAVLLYGTYYRGLLTFLPDILEGSQWFTEVEIFGRSFPPAEYVYSGMLTVGIAGQYVGGRATEHVSSTTAFLGALAGLLVLALAFIPAWNAGVVQLIAVSLGLGFFVYSTAPIYQVVIADHVAADVHGLSYGYTYLAMFGIGAVGATVAGTVLTYATVTTLFLVLALLAAAGCACVVALRRF